MATSLYADPSVPVGDICKALGVSRATLYRALQEQAPAQAAVTDGKQAKSSPLGRTQRRNPTK